MTWSIEEYLVHTLDYFEDYSGFFLLLAYDLRIDAYIDYRLGPIDNLSLLEPGLLRITRKSKRELTENSEAHIEFDLVRVRKESLNPIEAAHFQKFNSTHPQLVLEARENHNKKLKLCVGQIKKITPYNSPIYEKSFELSVTTKDLEEGSLTLLTRDPEYAIGDPVCFLIKKDKGLTRILGLKPRVVLSSYLDQKRLDDKNNELNLIEIT